MSKLERNLNLAAVVIPFAAFVARQYASLRKRGVRIRAIEAWIDRLVPIDQTSTRGASAQIQCIVRKGTSA